MSEFLSIINYVDFCQSTNWQYTNHIISKEKGRDYHAMASSQGMLGEGKKREKEGGFWLVNGVDNVWVLVMASHLLYSVIQLLWLE